MAKRFEYRAVYHAILDAMDRAPLKRDALIYEALEAFELTPEEYADNSTGGVKNELKARLGTAIDDMQRKGILERSEDGLYTRNVEKPVAIREERCEEEIIALLRERSMTKNELRDSLTQIFRTDETATVKDDNRLYTYMGQILKRLAAEKLIVADSGRYSIVRSRTAELNNRWKILDLRADFLSLLHSKGGEFFERYFMQLLEKYLVRSGKRVVESKTTGGAADGGIDGIAKTVDTLGFRETIMVQAKNRIELSTETEVRGFYGAVCAYQGSRGIFATSSDFHVSAKRFLDSIDNCVGVNGEKIFSMAVDTSYGIVREEGKLKIDEAVFS